MKPYALTILILCLGCADTQSGAIDLTPKERWIREGYKLNLNERSHLYRDNYEELIKLNALPIGVSTQTIDYIKEMTDRLVIPYDVLSDSENILLNSLKLPFFEIDNKV